MRSSKGLCRLGLEWEGRGLDELGFSFLMRQQFCFESRVHQVTDGGAEGDYEELSSDEDLLFFRSVPNVQRHLQLITTTKLIKIFFYYYL